MTTYLCPWGWRTICLESGRCLGITVHAVSCTHDSVEARMEVEGTVEQGLLQGSKVEGKRISQGSAKRAESLRAKNCVLQE